jgi:hypothetical protein
MTTTAAASGRFARQPGLAFRTLDDQTVIVDPQNRQVHVLNGTGSAIWQLLEGQRSVAEVVAELERDGPFQVERQRVASDVAAFLAELARKGLVVTQDPGRSP